jgi:hypothetical protein
MVFLGLAAARLLPDVQWKRVSGSEQEKTTLNHLEQYFRDRQGANTPS